MRRVRLADAGCDAESVMHLFEDDDDDDDVGSDAGAAAKTSRSEKRVKLCPERTCV
jgi:hypothetical protein